MKKLESWKGLKLNKHKLTRTKKEQKKLNHEPKLEKYQFIGTKIRKQTCKD